MLADQGDFQLSQPFLVLQPRQSLALGRVVLPQQPPLVHLRPRVPEDMLSRRLRGEEVVDAAADTCGVQTVRLIVLRTATVMPVLYTVDAER